MAQARLGRIEREGVQELAQPAVRKMIPLALQQSVGPCSRTAEVH
jgi:hypothetical protein